MLYNTKLNIIIITIRVKVFWSQVVPANAVVPLKIDISFVLQVKHSFNLITTYNLYPVIVSQDYGLHNPSLLFGIGWKSFLAAQKRTL